MKPSTPKGTRDFSPEEMVKRNFIFDSIKQVFQLYGYLPIETPAMENLSTLMGKYGEEGDKLIFKILNSGEYLSGIDEKLLSINNSKVLTNKISEKALKYDLTVPFARYVVQHQNEITFPFKRYQVQPVWRADRPQKGRYREFYQCDADVIGSNSLLNEVELVQIIDRVFTGFNLPVTIKINNRKILSGIAEIIGEQDKVITITECDITLARGLNYYTGAIFEVKANTGTLSSSICGGGRYDDLTGIFGLPNMSGVGISFGADRIYDVLEEMNLYPPSVAASTKVLFVCFGENEQQYSLPLLTQLRDAGINAEMYPDANAKMKKQMSYADAKKIPFVVLVGSDEIQSGKLTVKNMQSGEQQKLDIAAILSMLQ